MTTIGDEARAVATEWGTTNEMTFQSHSCLHEMFEIEAARTPESLAVVSHEGQRLTYGELNARANRLAWLLRDRGVGPESLVAIYLHHTEDLIVAVLGVLKAGAAYVPLDLRHPVERLARILNEGRVAFAVTHQDLAGALPEGTRLVILDGRRDRRSLAKGDVANPPIVTTPDNLAHVVFTSGSTGIPKGVLTHHAPLINAYYAWERAFELRSRVRSHCQITAFSFGVFHSDWIRALSSGGSLVLCPPEVVLDPAALEDVLRREHVHFAEFVPAVLRPLVRHLLGTGGRLPDLRTIAVGSDRWYLREHRLAMEAFGPDTRVIHSFGLTEAASDAGYFLGSDLELNDAALVPVGRPFANIRLYVLSSAMEPVPPGEIGELFIGGAGLTRGILHQPALTAERFSPDPFAALPGARCYRTGDLARWLPDGNLEFLGRADHQVKIRGFRVEPGEIEAALDAHDDVITSVVTARTGHGDELQLVAYVVPRPGEGPTATALRCAVRAKVPDFMVPAVFVLLDALPLTASEKVDRRALPEPSPENRAREDGFEAPRTPVEGVIAALFAELLGVDVVGVFDSFFDLGGHSLLAVRVLARVRDAFGVAVSVRELFEGPTVAELARCVEGASPVEAGVPLRRARRDRQLPLSFSQEQLWFLEQVHPGNRAYHLVLRVGVPGRVEVRVLEAVLEEMVRRHEVLRTTFVTVEGRPVQRIGSAFRPRVKVFDVGVCRDPEEAARQVEAAAFDLEGGPLLRVGLLRGRGESLVVVVVHHIVCDGWSLGVFADELRVLYDAFVAGEPSPLPDLVVQYADYAVWQRQWLQGEVLDAQLAYWKQCLDGLSGVLDLPTDRPRPPAQTFRGATRSVLLPVALRDALVELSQRHEATLFMTLLAAFHTLLHRLSGASDVAVGFAVANRARPELEQLIGFFVNTLVLRLDLSTNPSFEEVLGRVRAEALGAFAHQELPFERLVEELRPQRSLSHNPLFQAMFVLQNTPDRRGGDAEEPPRLPAGPVPGATKFDLSLAMADTPHGLVASWEYSTDLFDDLTIERFAGYFTTMLEGIVNDPAQPIAALPLLSDEERHQILVDWNDTALDYPTDRCVHELIAEQAARTPDAVAITFADEHLSYAELDVRANRLAHRLGELGVGPEVRVGICVERSPEMVIGMLAVLKAGGAYVPLDPTYPPERLAFMLTDSAAPVLLTQRHLTDRLPTHPATIAYLDPQCTGLDTYPTHPPNPHITSRNLAHVIYTSGSTGRPKGAMVEHRGLVNVMAAQRALLGVHGDDRVLQLSSFSFDASVFEVLLALGAGARLCLAVAAQLLPGGGLEEVLRDLSITTLVIPPSVLGGVLPDHGAPLRNLVVAGEACPESLTTTWAEGHRMFNAYGPTETSIWASTFPVERPGRPPIGTPIPNSRIYLLDDDGQPVPPGVCGELYIGGDGVGRGYLDRPSLTAERFVPDPFGDTSGARLFRTGDLGRFLPDGNIEFVRRGDQQVKVRGYRIELGEIESEVARHPAVRAAVVTAREDTPGQKRLVAYVVLDDGVETNPAGIGADTTLDELRAQLGARLPSYMVPTAFVPLERLPLSPSGKVDTARLPRPARSAGADDGQFTEARTPIEEIVANVWADVLQLDAVGLDEDFFELGGHSLLAAHVATRVARSVGVEVPIDTLFREPTVRRLAAEIQRSIDRGAGLVPDPVGRAMRRTTMPSSYAQASVWFAELNAGEQAAFNLFVTIPLGSDVQFSALRRALQMVMARHEILRTGIADRDGAPVQVIAPRVRTPFAEVDLRETDDDAEATLAELCAAAATKRYRLDAPPLFDVTAVRLPGDDQLLLLTMHHIISDGWSLGVLLNDLNGAYDAALRGERAPLPPLPIQYADYAAWQRRRQDRHAAHLQYWSEQLADAPPTPVLPFRRARNGGPRAGTSVGFGLDADTSHRLRDVCREEGVTLYMALLAGFQILLRRYTGAEDVVVCADVANRSRPETAGLIGLFLNQVVLRSDLSGSPSFAEVLRRVRSTALGAYSHQDVPFELVVEHLHARREEGRAPLAQIKINLQNLPKWLSGGTSGDGGHVVPAVGVASASGVSSMAATHDVTVFLSDEDRIEGSFVYDTDLFDDEDMQQLAADYRGVLTEMVSAPSSPACPAGGDRPMTP